MTCEYLLAGQGAAFAPVGPAVLQHEILPLFQQWRRAVPEERVLENDNVVGQQERLLARHVNVEGGVLLVEVVERDALAPRQMCQQPAVHP